MPSRVHLIQLAGGKGQRAGADGLPPKQFRPTGQGPLFLVSLKAFARISPDVGEIGSITITVPEVWREAVAQALDQDPVLAGIPSQLAEAGETRTRSTWHALQALAQTGPQATDLVAIHDAARPFADAALLERLVVAAAEVGGAVPAVPVADTVVQRDEGGRAIYLERDKLAGVQTPQVFRWDLLREAHSWAAQNDAHFTDDGGLLSTRGHDPVVVDGEVDNWKITTDGDWQRASQLLA